jgi:hypothetical protein
MVKVGVMVGAVGVAVAVLVGTTAGGDVCSHEVSRIRQRKPVVHMKIERFLNNM